MKKNIRGIMGTLAVVLVLALTLGMGTLAEEAATDTVTTEDDIATQQDARLQDAFEAYSTAKKGNRISQIEEELADMVAAGQLTQEQADLILNYTNERASLQNGICPNCGYEFQAGKGSGRRGGNGGRIGKGGRGMSFGMN